MTANFLKKYVHGSNHTESLCFLVFFKDTNLVLCATPFTINFNNFCLFLLNFFMLLLLLLLFFILCVEKIHYLIFKVSFVCIKCVRNFTIFVCKVYTTLYKKFYMIKNKGTYESKTNFYLN